MGSLTVPWLCPCVVLVQLDHLLGPHPQTRFPPVTEMPGGVLKPVEASRVATKPHLGCIREAGMTFVTDRLLSVVEGMEI